MKKTIGILGLCLFASAPAANAVPVTVDIMVAYDQSAASWLAGNGTDPNGFAEAQVAGMNTCLDNSGLTGDFSFRLVGTCTAAIDTSGMQLDEILVAVTGKGGAYAPVWRERDRLGADLFTFVTGGEIQGGQIGLGYTLQGPAQQALGSESAAAAVCSEDWLTQIGDTYCFNVCKVSALADVASYGYTMAHEIGHNMGCGHTLALDPGMGPATRFYTFSCASEFSSSLGTCFTVMGYKMGSLVPAPCFSSPDVFYDGVATGSAACDNVRTLRANCKYVARYRSSATPSPVPGPNDGPRPKFEGLAGAFRPRRAVNAVYPYVGGVYDANSNLVGLLQLKVGKVSKTDMSKVTAAVIDLNGKKSSAKPVQVPCGENAQAPAVTVKNWGTLALALAENGFAGTLDSVAYGPCTVRTAAVGGALASPSPVFVLKGFDFQPPDAGFAPLADVTADGEPILVNGSKWSVRKAAAIKYRKVIDDAATKAFHFELFGCGANLDPQKPNVGALKLSYTAKTGLFKGSFKAYASNAASTPPGKSPKLKAYVVNVTGFVVDGVGVGRATCKKLNQSFGVSVK